LLMMEKKRLPINLLILLFFLLIIAAPILPKETVNSDTEILEPVMTKAVIIDKLYEEVSDYGFVQQGFTAEILKGPFKGQKVIVENAFSGNPAMDLIINPGDKLIVALEVIDGQIAGAYPQDFYREFHIYLLIGLFIVTLLVIGRIKGIKAILTLGITVFLIAKVMLPGMLKGYDPLLLAIVISVIITAITLLIVSGFTTKTTSAIIGTTGGVLVAALISLWVGHAAKLTGLSGEEAQMLMYIAKDIGFNFKNLLFAGIIIGALGAVMDVSMSIASAMEEIKINNPSISKKKLIQSGMNVGKDIMGTMSNTLILAYTGTSIPLLLLFLSYQQSYLKIINMDFIATEFIRALSGSIGLIFSIPITALFSAALTKQNTQKKVD
jgi:uncharacterized membrane protein